MERRNWVWEEQRDFNPEALDHKAQRRGREGIALKCPDFGADGAERTARHWLGVGKRRRLAERCSLCWERVGQEARRVCAG